MTIPDTVATTREGECKLAVNVILRQFYVLSFDVVRRDCGEDNLVGFVDIARDLAGEFQF